MRHYIPTAGSIPARVIAWLEECRAPGEKVPGQVICEALGIRPTAFAHNLTPSMRAGLLHGEKFERNCRLHWFFWLGTPADRAPHERIAQRVVQHMKAQPPGTQIKTGDLAAAVNATVANLQELMKRLQTSAQPALRVQRIEGCGNVGWWSLTEFDPVDAEDDDVDMPPRRSAPEIQPRPGPFLPGVNVGAGARWITPVQIAA